MSAPRKLTPDEIAYVQKVVGIKRRIRERLPTTEQLAARFNVSPRLIDRVSCDAEPDSSTWNNLDAALTSLIPNNGATADN